MSPFYVIGHKNPDTDAICSAIGHAALLRATGEQPNAIAARCGDVSQRTAWVAVADASTAAAPAAKPWPLTAKPTLRAASAKPGSKLTLIPPSSSGFHNAACGMLPTVTEPITTPSPLMAAALLGVSRVTLAQLLHEHRALSGDLALRLEKLLGSSAESWLNMQQAVDLWEARQDVQRFAHVVRYANSQTSMAARIGI